MSEPSNPHHRHRRSHRGGVHRLKADAARRHRVRPCWARRRLCCCRAKKSRRSRCRWSMSWSPCPAPRRRRSRNAPRGRWKSCCGRSPASNTSTAPRRDSESLVIVRFKVGEDPERSLVKTHGEAALELRPHPDGRHHAHRSSSQRASTTCPSSRSPFTAPATITSRCVVWPRRSMNPSNKCRWWPRRRCSVVRVAPCV
jgi:hypothetical protein